MITMVQPQNQRRDALTVNQLRRAFRRNRWFVVAAPILTLAAALMFLAVATPVYDGTTALRLDQERSNLAVLDALQELSTGSEIMTEMAELRSRSLAEEVVDELDLNVEVRAPREVPRQQLFSTLRATREARATTLDLQRTEDNQFVLNGDRPVRVGELVHVGGVSFVLAPAAVQQENITLRVRSFPLAVRSYRRIMKVARPDREANILEIRYESSDPYLAMQVPNAVAAAFIQRRNTVRKAQAVSTVGFLNEQIDTLGAQLASFERRLQAFRENQGVISPDIEAETQVSKLAQLQADRDATDSERRALSTIVQQVERGEGSYRRLIGFPSLLQNPVASELLGSLTRLENDRTDLLRQRKPEDPEVELLTQRIRDLDTQLKSLIVTHLEGLTNRVNNYDQVLARSKSDLARIPAKEIQLAGLRRQGKVNEELFTALQTRLKEAEIAAAVEDPSVRVVDPAVFPVKPISPNRPLSIVLALVLGFALGLGLAFARESLNTTIRSREELQEESGAIPILGLVPRFATPATRRRFGWATNGGGRHAAQGTDAVGAVAEAYRTLRTNIAFTQHDNPAKALVITSALPGDGKSTSASNLAQTLARQGYRVALVDADMRRGSLHEFYDGQLAPGLSDVLAGRVDLAAAIQPVLAGDAQVHLLSTGTVPPNPAELIGSRRFEQVIGELKASFDAVIIDTPPLNLVTDAAILSARADGVLVVARSGVTDRDAFRFAVDQLRGARARILGCILNDIDVRGEAYAGKRGTAYYGPASPRA